MSRTRATVTVGDQITTLLTGFTLMKARFDHNVAMAALSKATGTLDGDSDLFYLARSDARTQEVQP